MVPTYHMHVHPLHQILEVDRRRESLHNNEMIYSHEKENKHNYRRMGTSEDISERYIDTGLQRQNISNMVVKIRDMTTTKTESIQG